MSPVVIVLGIVIVLAVVVLFWGLASAMGSGDKTIEDRLEQYTSGVIEPGAVGKEGEREKKPSRLAAGVDRAIAGRGFADKIATQLARADVKLTPGEYVILNITSILGFFLIGYLLFRKSLFMGVAAGVVGFYAPSIYLKIQQSVGGHHQPPGQLPPLWLQLAPIYGDGGQRTPASYFGRVRPGCAGDWFRAIQRASYEQYVASYPE
jgi:hypothetical protein